LNLDQQIEEIGKKIKDAENKYGGNSQQTKQEANPFIDAFKQISEEKDMKNIFDNLNINDFMGGDFGKNDENKQVSDLMGVLNSINQSDSSGDGDDKAAHQMFEQLFDMFIKEDVLAVPMATIKSKLQGYMVTNKDKITEEEVKKYNTIIEYVDEILLEIKKPNPNKEHVINLFEKLHTIGELPQEIMNDTNLDVFNFTNMLKK
jgi:chemotaxis regulatin CheY-phosphate phosphatase CheZ